MEQLFARYESFLEKDDGSGQQKILAVGLDVVTALQQTMATASVSDLTEAYVRSEPPAVLTFAADGGQVRRRSITVIAVSVSTSCLLAGRTDLTPILYVFSGETRVDLAISLWIRDLLAVVAESTLCVPVNDDLCAGADAAQRRDWMPRAVETYPVLGTALSPLLGIHSYKFVVRSRYRGGPESQVWSAWSAMRKACAQRKLDKPQTYPDFVVHSWVTL